MAWLIPILLWLTLTFLATWRDIPRIASNLEYTYRVKGQATITRAKIVSALIYLPPFAIMVLAGWLNVTRRIGEAGLCTLWIIAPLWIYLGYVLTGGRSAAT